MLCHLHTNRPPPCSRTLSPKYKNSKLDTTQLAENAALGFIKNTYISNYARYIYMPRTCTMPTSWRFDRHKNRIYGQLFMCSSNNNSNGTEISEKRQKDWCHTHAYMHTSRQKNGNDTTADVSSKICIKIQKRQNEKKSHNQQSMLVMRHSLCDEMHSRQWQWRSNHFYAYWTSIRILMKTIAKYLFYHRFKIIKSIIIIIISQTFSQTACSMPKYLVM